MIVPITPSGRSHGLVRIYHPVQKFDYPERKIVAARFYEISAEKVNQPVEENS